MLVLVTYDIAATDPEGRRRLQRIAKACGIYGKRVQSSVFECMVDAQQFREMQAHLSGMIDADTDSLRFYTLGNHVSGKIACFGQAAPAFQPVLFI